MSIKQYLKRLGITIVFKSDLNEYRVNYVNGKEATAYYTNDLADAFNTGIDMARKV